LPITCEPSRHWWRWVSVPCRSAVIDGCVVTVDLETNHIEIVDK
jgi:hypothetical protein